MRPRCASWREIYYDPSSGLLPSQLADPWDPFSMPCSSVTLVDGKLRLSNSFCMTDLGTAGFRRSEPDLLDAPLYLLQMDVNVLSVQPYVDPWSDPVLWFSWVEDGERLGQPPLLEQVIAQGVELGPGGGDGIAEELEGSRAIPDDGLDVGLDGYGEPLGAGGAHLWSKAP